MLKPKIVVLDEPVSALDLSIQAQVLNLLVELQQEFKLAYLFISHNLSVVRHFAEDVLVMYLGKAVEHGTREAIFVSPQHPYTRALLAASPTADTSRRGFRGRLRGELPSPLNPPSGCPFHPRCPLAVDICRTCVPELRTVAPGRQAACHRAEEVLKPSLSRTTRRSRADRQRQQLRRDRFSRRRPGRFQLPGRFVGPGRGSAVQLGRPRRKGQLRDREPDSLHRLLHSGLTFSAEHSRSRCRRALSSNGAVAPARTDARHGPRDMDQARVESDLVEWAGGPRPNPIPAPRSSPPG